MVILFLKETIAFRRNYCILLILTISYAMRLNKKIKTRKDFLLSSKELQEKILKSLKNFRKMQEGKKACNQIVREIVEDLLGDKEFRNQFEYACTDEISIKTFLSTYSLDLN